MWGLAHLWVVGTMIAEAAPPFVVFEWWGSLSRCNANHKPKAASPTTRAQVPARHTSASVTHRFL